MANPNTLGKFLRERRFEEGITLKALSSRTGLSQSDLSNIELGKRICPSTITIKILSNYYEISTIELAEMIDIKNDKTRVFIKTLKEKVI